MGPKKDDSSKAKRKNTNIKIDVKKEIISKHENGVRVSDLATQFGMAKSTICTILKNREIIKKADVARGMSVITKQRSQTIEEVEKLLLIWINDNILVGNNVSKGMICEKAKRLHDDLVNKSDTGTSGNTDVFKASRGWFERFKKRSGIYSGAVRHRDADVVSANYKAAEAFARTFTDYVKANGFYSQQVFNCNETGLFWRRMPRRTYISEEEIALPGYKPMKDRLTLLLCANASGDFKIKPLVVYHSENPRVFNKNNVIKSALPVMWRANSRAWVTRQCFIEWIHEVFAPSVKTYLQENNLPLKCLLVMDNAPAHASHLADELMEAFHFITVMLLPPNTTTLIQPMNQEVITTFKELYTKALFQSCFEVTSDTELTLRDFWNNHFNILHCLSLVDKAWQQVSHMTLNSAWRKLWLECVADFVEDFEQSAVIDDIVSLGINMGLAINNDDVEELLEEHNSELSTEELEQLQKQQLQMAIVNEISSEEEEGMADVPTSVIRDICAKWDEVQSFVERYHPDKAVVSRSIHIFNDNAMSHFRNIIKRRQNQLKLDNYLVRLFSGSDPESSGAKRQKK